jgi:aspartyl aminopeptidase
MTTTALDPARDLLAFVDASPSPFHAVAEAARRLKESGYKQLDERNPWEISAGQKSFLIRSGGTLLAFELGTVPPSEAGFLVIAAHTDSPNLRLKQQTEIQAHGFQQLGVEIYGGVLLSTWLDRDLGLAGRVRLRGGTTRLVRLDDWNIRVPNVAIHLNRMVNKDGLVLNPQQHMLPVVGLSNDAGNHEFKERLAHQLQVLPADILTTDLCCYDIQPSRLGGFNQEFVYAARLDNLASCHAGITALTESKPGNSLSRVLVLYDHEEVGSRSDHGADSLLLLHVLKRIAENYPGAGKQAAERALASSLMISADMAHAIHPNYSDKHDSQHAPKLGLGPVVKWNVCQSYATDGITAGLFEEACQEAGFSPQRFVSRNDQPCGSTVGPISAAKLTIRTVDVGNPMLSMHSSREMAASADVPKMIAVFSQLYTSGLPIDPQL